MKLGVAAVSSSHLVTGLRSYYSIIRSLEFYSPFDEVHTSMWCRVKSQPDDRIRISLGIRIMRYKMTVSWRHAGVLLDSLNVSENISHHDKCNSGLV